MHAHPGFVIVSRALELTEARGLFRRCRGLGGLRDCRCRSHRWEVPLLEISRIRGSLG
jgi:hypothetical protein